MKQITCSSVFSKDVFIKKKFDYKMNLEIEKNPLCSVYLSHENFCNLPMAML